MPVGACTSLSNSQNSVSFLDDQELLPRLETYILCEGLKFSPQTAASTMSGQGTPK